LLLAACLLAIGATASQAATLTVGNATSLPCTGTFLTIQSAITAASPGDTISVCPGTYNEQVIVNRSLTLTGAGSATTTIQAPVVLTDDPDGAKTLVLFTGPITAEFSGFTVHERQF
jgi:pectin methylesterase-like acyl-CoA thioesterase